MDIATIPKVIPSQAGYRGKSPEEQEKYEWYAKLRRRDFAKRDLTSATTGATLVAPPVLQEIFSMRAEYSLIDRLQIRRHPTDSLITNVASEVTGHGIQAAITEAAVHVANEPAFLLTAVTVAKYGSMITATEELLEDQALFQSWMPAALARMMGLQENAILYARLAAAGTLGYQNLVANTITELGLNTFYTAMPSPWRDGAKVVTNDATLIAIRALLIATPRAYLSPPEYSQLTESVTAPAMWMGLPMFLNSNWPTLAAAGAGVEFITMLNPDAVIFVERHGVEILTDPYGDSANGRTRFFTTARFEIACPIPLGVVHMTDV